MDMVVGRYLPTYLPSRHPETEGKEKETRPPGIAFGIWVRAVRAAGTVDGISLARAGGRHARETIP